MFKFKQRLWARTVTMASCEPRRSSAYSDDMRWRIVWQRHALGCTHTIATNLNIDVSTVRRTLDIFSATGTVSKKPYPADRAFRKINEPVQLFILHLLLQKPAIYLREITADVKCPLGLDITESAMCMYETVNFELWYYIIINACIIIS